jgi:flagellar biosynthesis/type III secretory pathway chaperone
MQKSTSFDINIAIDRAIEACDKLMVLLLHEKEIIISGEAEKLAEYNQQKTILVEQLLGSDEQLKAYLDRQEGNEVTTGSKWKLLQQKLADCQQQSSVNGAMINHCLKNTAGALMILRGGIDNGASTYSNDGKSNQHLDSRPIAKI